MPDFVIKQGDTRPVLLVNITDGGSALDLTSAVSAKLLMRQTGTAAIVAGQMDFYDPEAGQLAYYWSTSDTSRVGTYDCEVEITWGDGGIQTYPRTRYFSVQVVDDIESNDESSTTIPIPPSTPQTYGTGSWPWTPHIVDSSNDPITGATVSVVSSSGNSVGPATTDSAGRCLASDGLGAFRLNSGTYSVTISTPSDVTVVRRLVIDAAGNDYLT